MQCRAVSGAAVGRRVRCVRRRGAAAKGSFQDCAWAAWPACIFWDAFLNTMSMPLRAETLALACACQPQHITISQRKRGRGSALSCARHHQLFALPFISHCLPQCCSPWSFSVAVITIRLSSSTLVQRSTPRKPES